MTETLNNLKNNKTRKTAATQHQGGDAVERMKKFLSGLGKEKHGGRFSVGLFKMVLRQM
jgi:nucleolar MIF4G domain-containing protein 1